MKKILAFAGSNHTKSIHYQLLNFTASLISDHEINVIDIRDWDIPMYSIDLDNQDPPELILKLIDKIQNADGFIIASPEHNGSTPAFFKNIIDWLSRLQKKVFGDKPTLLLSTSPGANGGATNLGLLEKTLPYQGARVIATFALPSFNDNFVEGEVIGEQKEKLQANIDKLQQAL